MAIDFDKPPQQVIDQLVKLLEAAAARLRDQILSPPGRTANAQAWNQATAASRLAQINDELTRLKRGVAGWTSKAIESAFEQGVRTADKQAKDAGVRTDGSALRGSFTVIDRDAAELLARNIVGDVGAAIDGMAGNAGKLLRGMAATGITSQEVDEILAGRTILEGRSDVAIRELRTLIKKVHGETVTVKDKNGDDMTFKAGYYAEMVARTKTREAICKARHARLEDRGIDLVVVTGRQSKNFCSAYLGKVFSIGGSHPKYPPLSSLPGGGPPFHPNCSKSTTAFIEDLASKAALSAAEPDEALGQMLSSKDTSKLQRIFKDQGGAGAATERDQTLAEDIRARARAAGYEPPPLGTGRFNRPGRGGDA
jgi:hypothetical protein